MISKARSKADELTTVEGLKKNWAILSVAAIFMIAVWIRYLPEQGMAYLQALDPYMIYRLSQHIALEGTLPQADFMRYFPYNAPTYLLNQGDLIFPAIFYWMGPFLFFNYLEWAQFYPALMGGIGVLMAYFLGKELWGKIAGVSSAFFLATIAGVMHRTSAGFFEKEPLGTMFMMVSLYLFVRAWKYKEDYSGILSGLALGFFTISWGGSNMLWLLYPLTVGAVMLLNEDTESLIKAYTPTVIVGAGVAAALNPSRFWFTGTLFVANIGMLAVLWARYSVEELNLVSDSQLPYFVPGLYVLGAIMAALSPLYSNFIARRVMAVISMATQSGGGSDVVAGTVAENTAAGLSQLITQLGATLSAQVHPSFGLVSQAVGTWPLAFVGVALLATSVFGMILRKYDVVDEEIQALTYYKLFSIVGLAWFLAFAIFFQASIIIATIGAILLSVGGLVVLYMFNEMSGTRSIEYRWYYLLPLFWVVSNVLTAVGTSRLVFLAAFPVAMVSGYTFSLALKRLNKFDYSQIDPDNARKIKIGFLAVVVSLVVVVNLASGFASAQRLGGSPNDAWTQSLDYMENNTEPGSVILSWWDYGYWFESIGERPAVADGGNAGYYDSSPRYGKINYPLADFLTSSEPGNQTEFLRKHSVDYIVLDSTMIGKYQAVSQIANRDNSNFQSMITLSSCRPSQRGCSPSSLSDATSSNNGTQVGNFVSQRTGLRAYVPLEASGNDISISGPTTVSANGRGNVGCALTEDGVEEFNVENPMELGSMGELCVAEHPYYNFERGMQGGQSQLVLVPRQIADSMLVRLYLMNGNGVEYAQPVPEGSNGYVRMWQVDLE